MLRSILSCVLAVTLTACGGAVTISPSAPVEARALTTSQETLEALLSDLDLALHYDGEAAAYAMALTDGRAQETRDLVQAWDNDGDFDRIGQAVLQGEIDLARVLDGSESLSGHGPELQSSLDALIIYLTQHTGESYEGGGVGMSSQAASMLEYCLLIAIISIVCLAGLTVLGEEVAERFEETANALTPD
jgi:Flp pilus assembly pilin Flp